MRVTSVLSCLIFLITTWSLVASGAAPGGASGFAFELKQADVIELEGRLKKIRLGDCLQRAKTHLGKPSSESSVYKPQLFGPSKFLYTKLDYDLKRVDLDLDNIRDHKISLFFDESNRLVAVERHPLKDTQ